MQVGHGLLVFLCDCITIKPKGVSGYIFNPANPEHLLNWLAAKANVTKHRKVCNEQRVTGKLVRCYQAFVVTFALNTGVSQVVQIAAQLI